MRADFNLFDQYQFTHEGVRLLLAYVHECSCSNLQTITGCRYRVHALLQTSMIHWSAHRSAQIDHTSYTHTIMHTHTHLSMLLYTTGWWLASVATDTNNCPCLSAAYACRSSSICSSSEHILRQQRQKGDCRNGPGWQSFTTGPFSCTPIEGNHLWPLDKHAKVTWLQAIVHELDAMSSPASQH